MTGHRNLRVGSYNLRDGGIDDGDNSRLRRQLRTLADQNLHVVGLQEAKHWGPHHLDMASAELNMTPHLAPSAHHGCHLVIMVDENRVDVLETRHETGFPYWHAVACLRTAVDGHPVDFVNGHLAPSSPLIRSMEAQALRLFVKDWWPVIAMGDWNAASLDDPVLQTGPHPPLAARKLDTDPAAALLEAGLIDVGLHVGDLTPTVGHEAGLPYRCDRIYTTYPQWISGHDVTVTSDSDHALVVATFTVGADDAGPDEAVVERPSEE